MLSSGFMGLISEPRVRPYWPVLAATMWEDKWLGLIAFIKSLDFFSMKGPHGVVFSIGTGVGVFLWFLCLIKIVDRLESKLGQKKLFQLNRLCGVVILALGVYLIYLLSFGKSF